jgi:hypothetical protein
VSITAPETTSLATTKPTTVVTSTENKVSSEASMRQTTFSETNSYIKGNIYFAIVLLFLNTFLG